jgi:bifunctional DNase/RNase|uniref:Bifunctional nuclease family protein n=1 Tax=Mesoaciditoga lauensis TaxID=1495039 RepID=A0A7V3RFK2_9BACT
MKLKEAKIKGLAFDKSNNTPVVILELLESSLILPIWIGSCEAFALSLAIQHTGFPRPLTHDLILNVAAAFNAQPEKVVIDTLQENTYHAKLILKNIEKFIEVDCRPSDGIIIATKVKIPIYVEENIISESGMKIGDLYGKQDEEKEFKNFVENLDIDKIRDYFKKDEKGKGEENEGS